MLTIATLVANVECWLPKKYVVLKTAYLVGNDIGNNYSDNFNLGEGKEFIMTFDSGFVKLYTFDFIWMLTVTKQIELATLCGICSFNVSFFKPIFSDQKGSYEASDFPLTMDYGLPSFTSSDTPTRSPLAN
jgi:hypothetical protein